MPDLSEFIAFIAEKSGVNKPELIQKDLTLHSILRQLYSSQSFAENYLFKGGSSLIKCFFGYYRFSVDLDFTWKNQAAWSVLGSKELRRRLHEEIDGFGSSLESICKDADLEFENDSRDRRYCDFGGGGRVTTFKLWKNNELIKIQVNYVEEILFAHKEAVVRTLLDGATLRRDEEAYFKEFLSEYGSFKVPVYDEREILCEKVRAILTRRVQKLRDFYDLYMLEKAGFNTEALGEEAVKKTKASLRYAKYRENLERNRESLKITETLEDPYERSLFIKEPPIDFERFVRGLKFLERHHSQGTASLGPNY